MKKLDYRQALQLNKRLGLETWENDGERLFWATNNDETATWCFDSKKDRDEFVQNNLSE